MDKWYVGIPPQREVLFSGLNDNVDKKFLQEMCERYGRIETIKIYYDPQTKKHTGKGRVTFATTTAAKMAVSKLDHTSVMGNIIKAHIEPGIKGNLLCLMKSFYKPRLICNRVESFSNMCGHYIECYCFPMTVVHFNYRLHKCIVGNCVTSKSLHCLSCCDNWFWYCV